MTLCGYRKVGCSSVSGKYHGRACPNCTPDEYKSKSLDTINGERNNRRNDIVLLQNG